MFRPHAYSLAGKIFKDIVEAGFKVTAMETFHLDHSTSDKFLEVYKGVLDNHGEIVKELSSGHCLFIQVVDDEDEDVVNRFRQFCGPPDPDIARCLRPNTLRAKYGETVSKNAVHCTDLPEDGPLEVDYFLTILNKQ